MLTALFMGIQRSTTLANHMSSLAVFLLIALILPFGQLYRSYRQCSLWTLVRRVSFSWAFVLTGLLLLAFLLKISAQFSRQDMILWALLGWGLLLGLHVG
ncbi:MAG: undecaprenyl-phosphate glucose phosphotransferase, partial [Cyanobacteriota bacterium]